ncbi:N-acetylmuramoyl-L-alanine amidase [Desulfitobacterium dehalogenans ATCC 51507]|uniref:N-acetylmuramoyl-L-alanine amidase n=1 Tax=Desulfitobacterium dehalogenans (strain ATCC 51507 / DSM 9161 / JW/IU-DC1) TaxID=756499 RepID=I4A975_DESDJ|nr:cell wall-binding repeat-containing protein [Desulfitobacterium dehalogenans]AFM00510.1 N-acetylmuramoyl-L-alanine amidase [Desulfitobacterium dehalogenans ATCC 51507]
MKKVIFTLIASFTLVVSASISVYASPLAYPIERLSGQDRVGTALSISEKGWTSADTVILCEYADFPDSIASTPFAASLNAPILLTQGTALDSRVRDEIKRLQPSKVILLGGTGVLKPTIEEDLGKFDFPITVERIGGQNRYETSIHLAQRVPNDTVILANGDDFPDALSAASFAGIKQIPIILTSKKTPESVLNYLKETQPSQLIVIGGENAIPSEGLTNHGFSIETRLGGQNRYETNAAVISFVKDSYETDDLFLASGITFPDAVAGTVLAAKYKAPLLLSEKEDIPAPVYTYMREHMKVEPPRQSPETPATQPKQGKITPSGGLNLRESPSSSGAKIVTIPQGTTVPLLEEQEGWYKTTYDSQTGWVAADYLTLINSSDSDNQPVKPAEPKKLEGMITADNGLNLRNNPSSTGDKLVTIPKNATIQILAEQSGWYQTTYESKTGWISAEYVSLISPPAKKNGIITAANGLNLRTSPSSTGEKISTVPVDTLFEINEEQNGWYKISFESHTGWVSAEYVDIVENIKDDTPEDSTAKNPDTKPNPPSKDTLPEITIDLSVNGTVYILGGSGVISSTAQSIIEGKASSKYKENLREFPALPSEIKSEEPPQEEEPNNPEDPTPPANTDYDPSQEVLVDPFAGIPEYALAGKVIMIDPGHGGPDPGASGPSKTHEKNNTLPIALALKDILTQAGAEVLMTREDDRSPSTAPVYTELEDLKARVALANSCNADLFISIHNDSFTNSEVSGTSVYYSSANPKNGESLHLASNVRTSLISTINTKDRGVKQLGFYVLSNTKIPAILVETAFISNPYEEARLQNSTFRQNVAAGIFQGIYGYFTTPIPKD